MQTRIWICSALFAGLALLATTTARGQGEIEIPHFPGLPGLRLEGRMGAITSFNSGSFGRSVSMTEENGVRKITGQENGLKAYIEEVPGGEITIKVTRQYTRDQIEEISELEPELYMHLNSIPERTDTAEIEITVGISRTYTADDADDLKEKHPEAFEAYETFTSGGDDDFARLRERMTIPFRAGGEPGRRIEVPKGIRIHPEPHDDDAPADDKDEDGDNSDADDGR